MDRVYRASGLGGCIKAQVAGQLGFAPLDTAKKMQNMAREGALHELAVLTRLDEQGYEIMDRQREVTVPILPGVTIVGHLDATTYEKDKDYVVEVKSMSPDAYKEWKAKKWDTPGLVQKYKWQVSSYMQGMNYPLLFIVKNRSTGDWDWEYVEDPFYSMDELMARVLEIEKWVRRGELPDDCSVSQHPCPFYYLERQKSLELTEDAVLDDLVEMYEDAKVAVKAADERFKAAREAIREGMGDREKVVTEKSIVTNYQSKYKKVDIEKMKDDGVEVEKYYREDIRAGIRVTVRKKDDEREPGRDAGRTESDRPPLAQPLGESRESGRDGGNAEAR